MNEILISTKQGLNILQKNQIVQHCIPISYFKLVFIMNAKRNHIKKQLIFIGYIQAGRCYQKKGDFQQAQACFQRVIGNCLNVQFESTETGFIPIYVKELLEELSNIYLDKLSPQLSYVLGNFYEHVNSPLRSYEKAAYYYRLAADKDYIEAQHALAHLFEEGKGVPRSNEQAFFHYQLAAESQKDFTLHSLGRCFELGIGIEKSFERAFFYYERAANQGYVDSFFKMAQTYENGMGIERSKELATLYYQKYFSALHFLAGKGDAEAQFRLGSLYKEGSSFFDKSYEKAVHYLNLAAGQNFIPAQRMLAECYLEGVGVEQSIQQAAFYYRQAARQGDEIAQYELAQILKDA